MTTNTEIPIEDRYAAALIYAVVVEDKEMKYALPPVKTPAMEANEKEVKAVREMIQLRWSIERARRDISYEGISIRTKNNKALDEANAKLDKLRATVDKATNELDAIAAKFPIIARAIDEYYKQIDLHHLEQTEERSRISQAQFEFKADSLRHELAATTHAMYGFKYEHQVAVSQLAKRRHIEDVQKK